MLYAFERKILRRIYGWRCRWNSEIYGLYKDLNIVDDINIVRLGWAGRIIRVEEKRISKIVPSGEFYNAYSVGKPRTRWEDVVQREALQVLGIRGWRRWAGVRVDGGMFWGTARAQKGLWRQMDFCRTYPDFILHNPGSPEYCVSP